LELAHTMEAPNQTTLTTKQWHKHLQTLELELSEPTKNDLQKISRLIQEDTRWYPIHAFVHAPWAWVQDQSCIEILSDASGSWGLGATKGDQTISR
jgi:hypothetical protein